MISLLALSCALAPAAVLAFATPKCSCEDLASRLQSMQRDIVALKRTVGEGYLQMHEYRHIEADIGQNLLARRLNAEGAGVPASRDLMADALYDQTADHGADLGLHLEQGTFIRMGGTSSDVAPVPGSLAGAVDLVHVGPPSSNSGSAGPAESHTSSAIDYIAITGGLRVARDVEWLGGSSGITVGLPLSGGNVTHPPIVGPMVAVSARLDGLVSPGFGLDA